MKRHQNATQHAIATGNDQPAHSLPMEVDSRQALEEGRTPFSNAAVLADLARELPEKKEQAGSWRQLMSATAELAAEISTTQLLSKLSKGEFVYLDGGKLKQVSLKHDGCFELTQEQARAVLAQEESRRGSQQEAAGQGEDTPEGSGGEEQRTIERTNNHGFFGHSGTVSDVLSTISELAIYVKAGQQLPAMQVIKMGGKFFGAINLIVLATEMSDLEEYSRNEQIELLADFMFGWISFIPPYGFAISAYYSITKFNAREDVRKTHADMIWGWGRGM